MAGLILAAGLFACTPTEKQTYSEASWKDQVAQTRVADLYASHVAENGRFFAPWLLMPDKSFLDVMWWKLSSKTTYTEEEQAFLPAVVPDAVQRLAQTQGDLILWIGHNTFLVRLNGTCWLTDPIFSKRALVPARVTPPALAIEAFSRLVPEVNILISHNHYDHLDRATMKQLPADSPVFVPLGLKRPVERMNKTDVREMDWWEEQDLGAGVRLVCLPVQHWSQRIAQGRNKTLWASWLLITPDVTLYFGETPGISRGLRSSAVGFPGSTMRLWPPRPTIPGGSWLTTT